MKLLNKLGVICALVLAGLSPTTHAALIVPAGLTPGDTYHVIFVSSTGRNALSIDIADYDAHVQAAADAAGIGTSIGINWLAVGSTATVDAIDHLSPLFTDLTAPIYNQNGDFISANFAGLWDGSIDAPVGYDETGTRHIDPGVWTGTDADGTNIHGGVLGNLFFGVTAGNHDDQFTGWIATAISTAHQSESPLSIYGISSQLEVASTVPVPAAVWLFGSGVVGLFGVARRKARS